MGCVASKLEEEEEVVTICRERKRQLKLAVERRYALAEAHCKYCQALYAVSAAIKLFVARHSSPSPFLITFPPPCSSSSPPPSEKVVNNPMFLQQTPSDSAHEAIAACPSCASSSSTSAESSMDEGEEEEEEEEEELVEERIEQVPSYFYMQMPPPMPSPQREFAWDFFNPFDSMRTDVVAAAAEYRQSSEDDLRMVREEEGIPELEEAEEEKEEQRQRVVAVVEEENVGVLKEPRNGVEMVKEEGKLKQKGLTVIDTPVEGRELLEALQDIEDYFIRAYDSGIDVSRMLEANKIQLQSGLEEIKENSTKLIQAITWHRAATVKPSSCKSLVASSSKSSSSWTEFKNELFDDYGVMDSGSHSSTLGRLYAWEKKLYEEVKAGDSMRKLYEKRCSRLRNQDIEGSNGVTIDKTRVAVKDLYARILVAIRSAESISTRIEKLRDDELQPQIIELLKGLTRTWKIMLEVHETQKKIILEVKTYSCHSYLKFCNESHRLATLQLGAELLNWRSCFSKYVESQRAYIEALHGWLTKFVMPEVEFYSRSRASSVPYGLHGPPLLSTCRDWLSSMQKLPDKAVSFSLKSFSKDMKALSDKQMEEQQQKRRVESMVKELDRKILSFQKTENKFLEFNFTETKSELEVENENEYLTEKKDQLDMFRKKLDLEKEKHHNCIQEAQSITLNGIQTGFSAVFESLSEFAKASQKMYNDLVTNSENANKPENMNYIEGSQSEENVGR
ncbi:nitrate regulatory gene2 protein-like isoform X1 [Cucurbita moschata]|uniref:Nitrate regulatory gene2 protein-like isoform X1 n=2 Tax=Cucurbita moschata TaxID=3662 RepID=A0A6J1G8U8_CUCMO|nr:nitrate regulatory gene2 protein-like isoform X1 [Cucurbita moschata]XP_022948095.1 nitrate regulatory gene2 protein-like isoform X1 [Cucurbita moschata]